MSLSNVRASTPPGPVAVLGAGPIGAAWALVFARAGIAVTLQDLEPDVLDTVPGILEDRLRDLSARGLLAEAPADVLARVRYTTRLADAVVGATYVQECVAERVDVKRELALHLHDLLDPDVVVASSSSAITTTVLAETLPGRERCLVAHPANPPYLLPAVEVVPAPFTSAEAVRTTVDLLSFCGMRPVVLGREVEGFVVNRLQAAMLREAYCLVRDGVVAVDALDALIRDGVGRRWAFSGPFETADLNTVGGIRAHAERLGPAYQRMGAERGQHDPWTDDLVDGVVDQRRRVLPLDGWAERTRWREERLMDLAVLEAGLERATIATVPPHATDARV